MPTERFGVPTESFSSFQGDGTTTGVVNVVELLPNGNISIEADVGIKDGASVTSTIILNKSSLAALLEMDERLIDNAYLASLAQRNVSFLTKQVIELSSLRINK